MQTRYFVIPFLLVLLSVLPYAAKPQAPEKLHIGGSYFFEEDLLSRIANYLEAQLPQNVVVIMYDKTSTLHQGMEKHKPDILFMNSYSYVLGHEKYPDYEAFSALGSEGKADSYNSVIIASQESGLKSLDDLIARAKEVDFRFVHATSTSGHIVPRYEMRKQGMPQAEGKLKNLAFAGSHKKAIMQVVNGEAMAAACGKPSLQYLVL